MASGALRMALLLLGAACAAHGGRTRVAPVAGFSARSPPLAAARAAAVPKVSPAASAGFSRTPRPRVETIARKQSVRDTFHVDQATGRARSVPSWAPETTKVKQLKAQLISEPTVAGANALVSECALESLVINPMDLRGQWEVLDLKDEDTMRRSLLSGDIFQFVLGLYKGGFAGMQLMENLRVTLSSSKEDNGLEAETRAALKWGKSQDAVRMFSTLTLARDNGVTLHVQPRSVRSSALKVTLPVMQPKRELRIAYFDTEFLVLRDQRGKMDVLRRLDGPQKLKEEVSSASKEQASASGKAIAGNSASRDGPAVEHLLSEIESLKAALEAQRAHAHEDRAARDRYQADVEKFEETLQSVESETGTLKARLEVMDRLQRQLAESAGAQQQKSEALDEAKRAAEAIIAGLRSQAAENEEQIRKLKDKELSLNSQIKMLRKSVADAPRKSAEAEGYRAAIETAKAEMSGVRAELSSTKKTVEGLQKELDNKVGALMKSMKAVSTERESKQQLEKQLEQRQADITEQQQLLEDNERAKRELSAQLADAQEKLKQLERVRREEQQRAAQLEAEMSDIIATAKDAEELSRELKQSELEDDDDGGNKRKTGRWWRIR